MGSLEERIARVVEYEIQTDESVVYGDGFRLALAAYQALGLKPLLDHVSQCKTLLTLATNPTCTPMKRYTGTCGSTGSQAMIHGIYACLALMHDVTYIECVTRARLFVFNCSYVTHALCELAAGASKHLNTVLPQYALCISAGSPVTLRRPCCPLILRRWFPTCPHAQAEGLQSCLPLMLPTECAFHLADHGLLVACSF